MRSLVVTQAFLGLFRRFFFSSPPKLYRHSTTLIVPVAMEFPLYVEKYEIHGRIYRRNPCKRARGPFTNMESGGDTADLYGTDEEAEDGPSCVENLGSSRRSSLVTEKTVAVVANSAVGPSSVTADDKSTYPIIFNEKSNKWFTKVTVPRELIRFVVGAKEAMKRKIEEETNCRIVIPSKDKEEPLEIISKSKECISRCKDRIQLIVMNAREKAPYTHFVSFSAAVSEIQNSFAEFAEKVKSDEDLSETCRDEDLFQEPKKLHFTIVMLSLLDSKERAAAAETLKTIVETKVKHLLDGQPLDVNVCGLEYMNDDPTKVNVLYAVAQSERLQEVADEIAKGMKEAGFSRQHEDAVKIHLTLMNTVFAWEKGKKIYMDVTKLMEKYGDYSFGRLIVTEVHISSLNDPKDDDGYYKSIGSFTL